MLQVERSVLRTERRGTKVQENSLSGHILRHSPRNVITGLSLSLPFSRPRKGIASLTSTVVNRRLPTNDGVAEKNRGGNSVQMVTFFAVFGSEELRALQGPSFSLPSSPPYFPQGKGRKKPGQHNSGGSCPSKWNRVSPLALSSAQKKRGGKMDLGEKEQ